MNAPVSEIPDGGLNLVAGFVASPDVSRSSRLMVSLAGKLGGRDVTLKVVLLENGGDDVSARDALRRAVIHGPGG